MASLAVTVTTGGEDNNEKDSHIGNKNNAKNWSSVVVVVVVVVVAIAVAAAAATAATAAVIVAGLRSKVHSTSAVPLTK